MVRDWVDKIMAMSERRRKKKIEEREKKFGVPERKNKRRGTKNAPKLRRSQVTR